MKKQVAYATNSTHKSVASSKAAVGKAGAKGTLKSVPKAVASKSIAAKPIALKATSTGKAQSTKVPTATVVSRATAKRSSSGPAMLSKAQMRELEAKLQTLKAELEGYIREKAGIFNTLAYSESLIKGDDAEVAEKQRTNNAALQEIDILKHRLTLVKRALAKIEAGVFGICEETEEPIGFERLNIVPWARYSIHVQEVRERKLRDFRVSKLQAEY